MQHPKQKISLQINLSPGDYPSAKFILPHQLKILSEQVDEIMLIVESKPSKGRFSAGWVENKKLLDGLLITVAKRFIVQIIHVDYDKETRKKVSNFFFGIDNMPEKDFRGGPFYCYFYGLFCCTNNLVFHLDADIFLGGKSKSWIHEAKELFNKHKDLLTASPLPGPPAKNQLLIGQTIISKFNDEEYMYQLQGFSTRIFMINKSLLNRYKLRLRKPSLKNQIKALIKQHPCSDLPEHLISNLMEENNLIRIDFLGKSAGLWSLHPPYRNKQFYNQLEQLIKDIENDYLPESQKGFYDIVDEVIDWTDAKQKLTKNLSLASFFK